MGTSGRNVRCQPRKLLVQTLEKLGTRLTSRSTFLDACIEFGKKVQELYLRILGKGLWKRTQFVVNRTTIRFYFLSQRWQSDELFPLPKGQNIPFLDQFRKASAQGSSQHL
jgi:hypothetical protein